MFTERRSCVRHKGNGPVFASFDGVTAGMILDLSEQGLSMQTVERVKMDPADRRLHLRLDLPDSDAHLETTGYIAWADALGRAGVRFSDLPEEARQRIDEWLTINAGAPSHMAPKVAVGRGWGWGAGTRQGTRGDRDPLAISLEAETGA